MGAGQRAKRRRQALRRFEGDGGPAPAGELGPERVALARAAWQEPDEGVTLRSEAAGDERGFDGRRPRQHRHVDAGTERCAHQAHPGVGDTGQAGVGDEGDPLAGFESRQELGDARGLVVLVVRDQPRLDLMAIEQAAGVPRVFGEHEVGGPQLREHTQRDVLEVPDRRRADGQRHGPTPEPRARSALRRSIPPRRRARPARSAALVPQGRAPR